MKAIIHTVSVMLLFGALQAGDINQFDYSLSTRLQGSNRYPSSDIFFESVALGIPFLEFGSALELYLSGETEAGFIVAGSLLATQTTIGLLKYTIKRERIVRTYEPRLWNWRFTPSFPAGHAASTAAYGTIMSYFYPKKASFFIGFTFLSGYSQVYVGNHYISDVLAGWAVGYLVGTMIHRHFRDSIPPIEKNQPLPLFKIAISF